MRETPSENILKCASNMEPYRCSKSTPNRVVVRVKRRRSQSPVEALLLIDGVSQTKRVKIGKGIKAIGTISLYPPPTSAGIFLFKESIFPINARIIIIFLVKIFLI